MTPTPLIDFLGLLSTAPPNPMNGDMVMRSPAGGWTTFNPGDPGSVLITDPVTGVPTWEPADISWRTPSLSSGWVNYGTPFSTAGYRKNASGLVMLKGTLKSGTSGTIFTLPAGYRPLETRIFAVTSNATLGEVRVSATGAVTAQVSNPTYLTLDSVLFIAEQ